MQQEFELLPRGARFRHGRAGGAGIVRLGAEGLPHRLDGALELVARGVVGGGGGQRGNHGFAPVKGSGSNRSPLTSASELCATARVQPVRWKARGPGPKKPTVQPMSATQASAASRGQAGAKSLFNSALG